MIFDVIVVDTLNLGNLLLGNIYGNLTLKY